MFLGEALHHVKIAPFFEPDLTDPPDPMASGVEDVEPDHLEIIIFAGARRVQGFFRYQDQGPNQWLSCVDFVDAFEPDERKAFVRPARCDLMCNLCPLLSQQDLPAAREEGTARVIGF